MKGIKLGFKETNSQRGAVAIIVAFALVALVGMAALVLDIGYGRVVRNQLQNAADAAALAACNHFYARPGPIILEALPNWDAARAEAASAIKDNKADNKQLQVGTTEVGWWDITQVYPGNMWPDPLQPNPPNVPPTANYGPAARVTITKTTGQNDGPISSFFGRIFGRASYDNQATATAVAASPGSVRPESVVPVAIAKEVADKYATYNNESNPITIGSPYMYPNSLAGQFTSFQLDTNNVPDVQTLISDGNGSMLSTGDNIWIQPGVKDTLYDQNNQPSIENNFAGKDIFFPIVDASITDTTHSSAPIAGFIGFHILCAGKGCDGTTYDPNPAKKNEKVIVGYFTTAPAYGGPVGPHYGPLDRCRLCR